MSQARDTGPPPRRPPERPRDESVRKRGLANCELRSLWDKCKQFALVGGRDICLALAEFSAEELTDCLADRRWRWREL